MLPHHLLLPFLPANLCLAQWTWITGNRTAEQTGLFSLHLHDGNMRHVVNSTMLTVTHVGCDEHRCSETAPASLICFALSFGLIVMDWIICSHQRKTERAKDTSGWVTGEHFHQKQQGRKNNETSLRREPTGPAEEHQAISQVIWQWYNIKGENRKACFSMSSVILSCKWKRSLVAKRPHVRFHREYWMV